MTLAQMIVLALQSSVGALVFSIGLCTTPKQLTHLLRRPGLLIRSLVSMNLAMLIVATGIVRLFPLHPEVKLMLLALALSPTPPVLPKKLVKAGGREDYVMALLVTTSLFAIVWIPFAGRALGGVFPAEVRIPAVAVAKVVGVTVLGPTLAGVVVRGLAPALAARIATPLAHVATVLLLAGLGLVLGKAAPAMLAVVGDGALLAIVLFLVAGLLVGHGLGGPAPGDRSVLALATALRHPGVAMAIAQITFPTARPILAALLLYLVAGVVVTAPYVRWRRRVLFPAASMAAAPVT